MSTTFSKGVVSVIIPAYRASATVRTAIDSVLSQTYSSVEVIVVDDGSPDDTVDVVRRTYGSRVILLSKTNGGAACARNLGIERATGEYIAFLDADDYWEPHKLERQLGVLARHPEVGLVAGAYFQQLPGSARTPLMHSRVRKGYYGHALVCSGARAFNLATMISTVTVLVRRSALGAKRFCTDLQTGEDRDLWVRIVAETATYLIDEPLATVVFVEGSLSRTDVARDCTNMLKVVDRNAELLGRRATRLWRSHTLYRWAACDSNTSTAIPRLLQSFVLWPMPYGVSVACRPLGRVKRLFLLTAFLLRGNASCK